MRRFRRLCGNFKVSAICVPTREDVDLDEPLTEVVEPVRPVEEPEMRKSIVWMNVVWWSIVAVLGILKAVGVITWDWWILVLGIGGCMVIGAVLSYAGMCIVSLFWGIFGGVHNRQQEPQFSSDGWVEFHKEKKPVKLFGIVNPKAVKKYLGYIIKRRRK